MNNPELDALKNTVLELEAQVAQQDLEIASLRKGINRLSSDARLDVASSSGYPNWPPFIMTTAFSIITCCDGVYKSIKHTDQQTRAFYGITWDADTIYHSRSNEHEYGYSEHLVSLGPDFEEIFVLPGTYPAAHQIYCHEDSIAITSPGEETRGWLLNTDTHEVATWGENIENAEHLNAVYRDEDSWWINFNNYALAGISKVVNLSDDFSTIIETIDIGEQVHNVARVGDLLYLCSSGEGRLIVYSLSDKSIVGEVAGLEWVRGLVITDEHIIVGAASATADQEYRLNASTEVHLIDRSTLVILDTLNFSDCGPVYELRGIGPVDLAHNGVPFPGNT